LIFSSIGIDVVAARLILGSALYSNNNTALIFAAFLADDMRQLLLAAVRAIGDAGRRKEVVTTALGGALLGMAALRIRHGETSSKWPAKPVGFRLKSGCRPENSARPA
jgi:hypothetical protein